MARDLRNRYPQIGLSLIESSIALSLIGLVVLFIFNLYPTTLLTLKQTENRFQAQNLAASILADQLALPFDDLAIEPSRSLDLVTHGKTQFQPEIEIFEIPENPEYLKGLRVTVHWEHGNSKKKIVREVRVANIPR